VVPEKLPPVPDEESVGTGTPEVKFEAETGPTVDEGEGESVTVVSDVDVEMMIGEVGKEVVALPLGVVLMLDSEYVTVYVVAVIDVEKLSVEAFE